MGHLWFQRKINKNVLQKTLTGGGLYHFFSYKAIYLFLRKKKRKRKKNEENFIKYPIDETGSPTIQNKWEKKTWKKFNKGPIFWCKLLTLLNSLVKRSSSIQRRRKKNHYNEFLHRSQSYFLSFVIWQAPGTGWGLQ